MIYCELLNRILASDVSELPDWVVKEALWTVRLKLKTGFCGQDTI
jgi:hypothetical protein